MAIKGIESQMMITRSTDYTKEMSAQQRRNELMHDYLTVQLRTAEAQEKQKVLRTIEAEKVRLRPDEGEGGGSAAPRERRSDAKKGNARDDGGDEKPGVAVASGEHIIDIKI